VNGLIRRELTTAGCGALLGEESTLRAVAAWLVINSMKSDRIQYQQRTSLPH
jgi:hypothetical protein